MLNKTLNHKHFLNVIYKLQKNNFHKINKHFLFKTPFKLISSRNIMDLTSVLKFMEAILPPELAEKWDKTGLLVKPESDLKVSSIFFTIDLTEEVFNEAMKYKANMIIAYHPPIFTSISKFNCDNWKDRLIMKCIKHSVAVYSPHTVCDNVKGGVNDWLISCFDSEIEAILPKKDQADFLNIYEFTIPSHIDVELLGKKIGFKLFSVNVDGSARLVRLSTVLPESPVREILSSQPEIQFVSVTTATKRDISKGVGRIAKLKQPLKLSECISVAKAHLKLQNVRLALGVNHKIDSVIETIAVCAGSGASVLKDVKADLYLTGEMSHHDVLDAIHKNVSIILVEHSNSERGYLQNLVDLLKPQLHGVDLTISKLDKDPISIV